MPGVIRRGQLIGSIEDLSRFLHMWYGERDGRLALAYLAVDTNIAPPLLELWRRVGRLCRGYDEWVRIGTPSPLACQDGLADPGGTLVKHGLLHFRFENQGNWSMAYRTDDPSRDPLVLSNAIELDVSNAGHVPIGARLSDLLITSALMETVFFACSSPQGDERTIECSEPLWCGAYYNAPGFDAFDGPPSHRFTTNLDRSLICAEISAGFDPIIAYRDIAQTKWERLQQGNR